MSKLNPHPSHDMGAWENTIVTIISTSRFGSVRTCNNCGGEHAQTVAGEAMHDELYEPCPYSTQDQAPEGGER